MGVYVHIPFCEQKCYYCDFHSVVAGDEESFSSVVSDYFLSLRREALYYKKLWEDRALRTIFIGGGTPSIVPAEQLASFILFLRNELPFVAEPEITIEANPHSLHYEGAAVLSKAGANRVSLGVQAFQNRLLKAIGRVHTSDQIGQSVGALKRAGITNINLDLMFGLPGQGISDWTETLREAVALRPTHLSCYGLILEDETPLARWVSAGIVHLPSDDEQAEMYDLACEMLKEEAYEHYEISNFCEPGMECQHNLLYWHNEPFIALGSGATGYIDGFRYKNMPDIQGYIESWTRHTPYYEYTDQVSLDQEMDETMMVGMRLLRGVEEEAFFRRYQVSFRDIYREPIEDLLAKGLVQESNGCLRVTRQGLFLENMVSGAFLR
ncbi:MAG TPA: radical SAM family heme chaperone HemW [Firmicutes bacterium]|nr:radical SAM family heme chaperone HemW [Bacillota bacterium]